jgi:hypothetical protein
MCRMETPQGTPRSAVIVHRVTTLHYLTTAPLNAPLQSQWPLVTHHLGENFHPISSVPIITGTTQRGTHCKPLNSGPSSRFTPPSFQNLVCDQRTTFVITAENCLYIPVHHLRILHSSVHMSTGDTAATLQLSEQSDDPLTLNDCLPVLHEHRYLGAVPYYHQVIRYIINMCLADSDGTFSRQEFPARPDAPSLVKSVLDLANERPSVVRTPSHSHGCQCQQLSCWSYKVIPYGAYPTRSVSYNPPSRILEPQLVSLIMISPFQIIIGC